MKLTRRDISFTTAISVLVVVLTLLLVIDLKSSTSLSSSTKKIAKIVFKRNIAQRKATDRVIWSDMQNHDTVFNLDSIRTDSNSEATIILEDGTSLELESNSMVLLDIRANTSHIQLESGSIKAGSRLKGGRSIQLSSGREKITLKNGSLQLSKEGEAVNLAVTDGTATVETEAGTTRLGVNETVRIKDGQAQVKEKSIILLKPVDGFRMLTSESKVKIKFEFKSALPAWFELSRKKRFEKKELKRQLTESTFEAQLKPGKHFWRIRNEQGTSLTYSLLVVKDDVTELFSPARQVYYDNKNKVPVRFSWSANEYTNSYILELAESSVFLKSEKIRVFTNSLVISLGDYFKAEAGKKFYFRVRPVATSAALNASYSRTSAFTLVRGEENNEVALLSPQPGMQLAKNILALSGQVFSWQKIPSAEFMLQILDKNDKIVFSEKAVANFRLVKVDLPPAEYHWRVLKLKGVDEQVVSKPRKIIVNDNALIDVKYPRERAVFSKALAQKGIRFLWSQQGLAQSYRLYLKKKNGNMGVQQFEVTGNSFKTTLTEEGTYSFWLEQLNTKKEVINKSRPVSFKIDSSLVAPSLVYPRLGQQVNMANKSSLQLRWKKAGQATEYEIKLIHLKTKKTIIHTVTGDSSLRIKDLSRLDVGSFKWWVRGRRKSGSTLAKSPKVHGRFNITLGTGNFRPQITSESVQYIE